MTEILLIIALVLSAASIALGIIILIRLSKRPSESQTAAIDLTPIETSLNEMKGSLPYMVEASVAKKMAEQAEADNKRIREFQESMSKSMMQSIENDTKRFSEFQATINSQLNQSIEAITKKIDDRMTVIDGKVNESLAGGFKTTSESMEKLQNALGAIQNAQDNIKELSADVLSLKNVLSNNMERGRYGEMQLEMAIQSMFGEANRGSLYEFQYTYKYGSETLKPDAVVFLDDEKKSIVCIDSKFSVVGYESLFGDKPLGEEEKASLKAQFKSALQTQIKEVAKYVDSGKVLKPAIMFIPNDGIFAYVQLEFPDVIEAAKKKEVVLVSPTILQPIIASFRMVQIDAKRAKNLDKIKEALVKLGDEFKRFAERWEKVEANINTLQKNTGQLGTTVEKITKKFDGISSAGAIPETIEEPEVEQIGLGDE